MSTETFLGAYLSRFEEDHLEMEIKNFKNIFSNTDYLLRVFIEFERMNSRHQDFMYQQKKIVNETFDDVIFKIAKFEERIKPLKQSDPNVDMIFQYFEPFQTIYSENVNRIPDYNVLMNEFFFKLQSSIVDSVKDLGFLEEILPIIKKGGTALSNLERNSLSFVDECREDREKLQNAVEYLEEISKKMKEFKN